MVKFSTIKVLLFIVVKKNWTVYQLDENNSFLHGDLHEEVYMKPPLGMAFSSSVPTFAPLICKLNKSLYDLKQDSRQWFSKLSDALSLCGYSSSKNDYSLFTKRVNRPLTVLAVYVDNILLAGDDISEMDDLKLFLDTQFKIKDLGLVHYFLGLEMSIHPKGYLMTQQKFTSDLLAEFYYDQFFPVSAPLDASQKLTTDMGAPFTDPSTFCHLVGKLNFLQHMRPDVFFAVQYLSLFLQAHQVPHLMAGIHVLKYLLNAPTLGLLFNNSLDYSLLAYFDSDWAACADSRC